MDGPARRIYIQEQIEISPAEPALSLPNGDG
jgi:hypothetical protein